MPQTKVRINVMLSQTTNEVLTQVAQLSGESKSALLETAFKFFFTACWEKNKKQAPKKKGNA